MAAEIQPQPQARKPCLLSKIDAFQEVVSTAVIIPKEDGVISVSEDRTIRVWLKRDSGQYWPSIYHTMPSSSSCMSFNPETRRLSVGMDTGSICEFVLSEDYNKITPARTYQAHQGRVTVVLFVLEMEWLLSTGQDKSFTWHCSESGQQLGTYRTAAWVSGLQFDVETRHAFVGDQSGQVTILKLEQDICSLVTTFKGHTGTHTQAPSVLIEAQMINFLKCAFPQTPEWLDSDSCQKCEQPFFWNFKQMWDSKKIGLRQHHCRKCGQAVCGKCSSKRSTIPLMGFEFEVRVCDSCHESISDEDRAPTATFHDSKHSIVYMHYEPTTGNLLTSGTDKIVKLWDMTPVVS
ncbi:WD repeat and FYVE domain-containing protein 2 [Neolamprologus brichardi]|uniref:WD repeat and FYVE domain-containing protein 2 n=1 Tax=Neolamprologus brichardi TaxID=32507 RepID=UPI0016438C94|nr:WD repeat and FYVE domain-containing protein 2 [Neolamprologus brichardi]